MAVNIDLSNSGHIVFETHTHQHDWRVERIMADGSIEQAIFIGPNAEKRARDYEHWHYRPKAC